MVPVLNCWEVNACGREVGGKKVRELGLCPAATDVSANGLNHGTHGGRICWAIAGTLCGGQRQGTYAEKRLTCIACSFYQLVKREENATEFRMMRPGQEYTASK